MVRPFHFVGPHWRLNPLPLSLIRFIVHSCLIWWVPFFFNSFFKESWYFAGNFREFSSLIEQDGKELCLPPPPYYYYFNFKFLISERSKQLQLIAQTLMNIKVSAQLFLPHVSLPWPISSFPFSSCLGPIVDIASFIQIISSHHHISPPPPPPPTFFSSSIVRVYNCPIFAFIKFRYWHNSVYNISGSGPLPHSSPKALKWDRKPSLRFASRQFMCA